MRPATIRRFALVAAMVLLAPIWCRSAVVQPTVHAPGAALVSLAPVATAAIPAIRRQVATGWRAAGSRTDLGRGLLLLGVAALLFLLRLAPWARLALVNEASSPLGRRRHAIALRAPPLPFCTSQS